MRIEKEIDEKTKLLRNEREQLHRQLTKNMAAIDELKWVKEGD